MKSPKEKTLEFVQKNLEKEKDKWNTGFGSNHYDDWENFYIEFTNLFNNCNNCKKQFLDMIRSYDIKISRLESILKKYGITER